jgi:hypothetical protein
MKNNIDFWPSLSIFHSKFVEKMETHFKFSIPPAQNNEGYVLYEKWCAQQATDDNMVHAHGIMDN